MTNSDDKGATPVATTREHDCKNGNGQAIPHYWKWKAGSDMSQKECSTCGKVKDD